MKLLSIILFFLSTSSDSFSQPYYCRYIVKSIDSSITYREGHTDYTNDLQTYMLDKFFYGNIIESWVFKDSIYQKIITTYEREKNPVPGITYEDSFGSKGLSGKVFSDKGMHGSIKLNFDTTILNQASLYDKVGKIFFKFYTNIDTGVVCSNTGYIRFVKSKTQKKNK